jgi:hypothetical protein
MYCSGVLFCCSAFSLYKLGNTSDKDFPSLTTYPRYSLVPCLPKKLTNAASSVLLNGISI